MEQEEAPVLGGLRSLGRKNLVDWARLRWATSSPFAARGWLAAAVDTDVARTWVGEDAARARALASAAPVGGAELADVVRFLLTDFGDDDEVASALVGEFISGTWWGPESDRLERQIEEVDGWIHHPGVPEEVVRWARRLKDHLNGRLRVVEQREAEEYG